MNLSETFTRVPECLCEYMDDGAIVYNPLTTRAFELNTSSLTIWELLDGTLDVSDIIALLTELYEAPDDTIRRDVETVIQVLLSNNALLKTH